MDIQKLVCLNLKNFENGEEKKKKKNRISFLDIAAADQFFKLPGLKYDHVRWIKHGTNRGMKNGVP